MRIVLTRQQEIYVTELCRGRQAGENDADLIAVRVAYPQANPRSQAAIARRLRRDARIQAEIAKRSGSREELIAAYREIANHPKAGFTAKLAALKAWERLTKGQSVASQNNGGRHHKVTPFRRDPNANYDPIGSEPNLPPQQEGELSPEFVAAVMASAQRELSRNTSEITNHDAPFHVESSPLQGPATPVHPMLPDMLSGRSGISSEPASSRSEDFET